MRIQIYTMQSVDEAQSVVALGVDHIGLTPGSYGLPGEIDYDTAHSIVSAIGPAAVCVALSVDSNLDAIEQMVHTVQPDILHLCGLEGTLLPEKVKQIRTRLPGLPIMQAISVAGPQAIETALAYEDVSEYLILDTQAADIDGIGASGETHDWNISREIVRQVQIPVILAGGLSSKNVSESVKLVQPWGVDSLTHTNQPLKEGGFRKDLERIRQFVQAAKSSQ
jgi:phosphoribosylanthranilate isomerase